MFRFKSLLIVLISGIVLLSSCRSSSNVDSSYIRTLAKAGIALGVDIDEKDPHLLYLLSWHLLGTPYKLGGSDEKGFDCSGLSSYLYKNVYNRSLPRRSIDQYNNARAVDKSRLSPGCLVFFSTTTQQNCGHVGVYLKDGKFVHASQRKGVCVSNLSEKYWKEHWIGGGY